MCSAAGRRARTANVTLISFTATSLIGQPEIFVEWETAHRDRYGRILCAAQSDEWGELLYPTSVRFEPAEGDSVTGALYDWIDETTTLNTTYYYRLEEIPTDAAQSSITHDPVLVVAGWRAHEYSDRVRPRRPARPPQRRRRRAHLP